MSKAIALSINQSKWEVTFCFVIDVGIFLPLHRTACLLCFNPFELSAKLLLDDALLALQELKQRFVTVITPQAIDSEVWAKPYFIQGSAWTAVHKLESWRVLFCENTPGTACSWVE